MDESSEVPDVVENALRLAEERQKPLVLPFFSGSWLCEKLVQRTLSKSAVRQWMKDELCVPAGNFAWEESLLERYRICRFPSLLFLDENGLERERIIGFLEPQDLMIQSGRILEGESIVSLLGEALRAEPLNMELRLELGRRLVERGRLEEALHQFLRVWKERKMVEPEQSATGRCTSALREMLILSSDRPQAVRAMKGLHDECFVQLQEPGASTGLVKDYLELNRRVGRPEDLLELWGALGKVKVAEGFDATALSIDGILLREVRPWLLAEKRYEEFLNGEVRRLDGGGRFLPDTESRLIAILTLKLKRFCDSVERLEREHCMDRRREGVVREGMKRAERDALRELADWFEALIGTSKRALALWLVGQCYEEFDSRLVGEEFGERCRRFGVEEGEWGLRR